MTASTKILACALAAGVLLTTGCGTTGGSSHGIDEVHLFGLPAALNTDNVPGPDAFSVRVFASNSVLAKGVAVRQGALEIVLYDGGFTVGQTTDALPLRTWSFTPQQLKGLANENRLGIGYEFTLPWAGTPPRRNRVTVVARYRPPSGPPVISGPASITLTVR